MNPKRLTIRALRATGKTNKQAELTFTSGANAVVGPSNTGKTFVFEAIDFVLGSGDELRQLPEGEEFSNLHLDFDATDGPPFRLRRAISGGAIELTEYAKGFGETGTRNLTLAAIHSPNPEKSLSAYLLTRIGLEGRQLRTDQNGAKASLSFRLVTDLVLIGEERIIQKKSPIYSGQFSDETRDKNEFGFFLTGQDDSEIVTKESQKKRNARLAIEATVIDSLLQERRSASPAVNTSAAELAEQSAKLDAAIKIATSAIVANQVQINEISAERSTLTERRTSLASRATFVAEQLNRLRLLDAYYVTDTERLVAVIGASRTFHEMPEGICPLCNGTITAPVVIGEFTHDDFETACGRELAKIEILRRDLGNAIGDFDHELRAIGDEQTLTATELADIERTLQAVLAPAISASQDELDVLMKKRTELATSEAVATTIESFQAKLSSIALTKKQKVAKSTFTNRVTTATTAEFCQIVEGLLESWNYPQLGKVSFDTEKCDLVIGRKDRSDDGKGYRAIAYAAFTIGLMKYCRAKGIPHPGFVILDTPLNPYKGVTPTPGDGEDKPIPLDVKAAFWKYLADEKSDDQIIIIENEGPAPDIIERLTYHSFSRNKAEGRYGFFP
jgi:hypothetical protein